MFLGLYRRHLATPDICLNTVAKATPQGAIRSVARAWSLKRGSGNRTTRFPLPFLAVLRNQRRKSILPGVPLP